MNLTTKIAQELLAAGFAYIGVTASGNVWHRDDETLLVIFQKEFDYKSQHLEAIGYELWKLVPGGTASLKT